MGVKNAVYLCIEQQNQNRNISIETDSNTVPYILRNFNLDSIQCNCQTSMFHTVCLVMELSQQNPAMNTKVDF